MSRRMLTAAATTALSMIAGAAHAVPEPVAPTFVPVDVGPKLSTLGPADVPLDITGFEDAFDAAANHAGGGPENYVAGDIVTGLWYDDTQGLFLTEYEVRAVGQHIEVWVMTDLSFPEGDPRNPVTVTDEQIAYLVDQFDNVIYPNNTAFFGEPVFHDGSLAALPFWQQDPEGRVIAMISNIGDQSYWDASYPSYIGGFYWGSVFEYYMDRNVISIDAYDWANRVGPDDSPWRGPDPDYWIANLYEGVFAHEFQHLIHDDIDPDEEVWVDEGCADFAMYLNGYGHPEGHVQFFLDHAENSLVQWSDQSDLEILADYGNAYLWTLYLKEQYGEQFIREMVANPLHGIDGINSTLASHDSPRDFRETFYDYQVALVADADRIDLGKHPWLEHVFGQFIDPYAFQSIDVAINVDTEEAFATPGAPPWGADYVRVDGSRIRLLRFDGDDITQFTTAWSSDGESLWAGTGSVADHWAIFEATGGGTLAFDTYYDIEPGWDFGFVQLSADNGVTWTSLSNAYTVNDHDPGAISTAVENLPGLTGSSGGWLSMSFDLSAYAGQNVLLAFRYVTDWAYEYDGWFVDNVTVDGQLISDGSSTEPFRDITELHPIDNDFGVRLVAIKHRTNRDRVRVVDVSVNDVSEAGTALTRKGDEVVMMVTSENEIYSAYAYQLSPH